MFAYIRILADGSVDIKLAFVNIVKVYFIQLMLIWSGRPAGLRLELSTGVTVTWPFEKPG